MTIKFNIISFNKKLLSRGTIFSYVGIAFLFLNLIPGAYEKTGMLISISGGSIILCGFALIHFAESKPKIIGELLIDETEIFIKEYLKNEIHLLQNNSQFKFENLGYKGRSNYIPFLTIGSLTSHSGVNKIKIYSQNQEYCLDILIENEKRLNLFLQFVNNVGSN